MMNLKCKVLALTMGASVLIGGKAFAQVPSYVPTNGLVGWWPFNGNANDESGNGNNGTASNMIWGSDRFGNSNSTAEINGVITRQIVVLNPIGINSNKKTLSSWIKFPTTYSNGNYYNNIFEVEPNPTSDPRIWHQIYGPTTGYIASGLTNKLGFSGQQPISQTLMNTNVWNHVLYLVDGDLNLVKLYLNGIYQGEITFPVAYNLNNWSRLIFGQSFNYQAYCSFSGQLDDFGIWDRLLDECEITDLFNAQLGSLSFSNSSVSINPTSSAIGSNATLSVSTPIQNLQWQSNPSNIGWVNLVDNSNYNGVNNDTLVVSNLQLSNHNQSFRFLACGDTSDIESIQIADTCITNVSVFDTTFVTVYDTTYITVSDTLLTTVTDTLIINTTLSLPAPNNANTIKVYPNPASDHITIDNGNYSAMAGYSIKITNNAGQQVFQSAINQQQFYVDLSTWNGNGLYFVHLFDPQNNTVTVRKIVLQ